MREDAMRTGIVSAVCSAVASAWLATAGGAQGLAGEDAGMSGNEDQAIAIMLDFAERTGLTSEGEPQRYLWTDAFALHNFLDLYQETGDPICRLLASDLIDQVHGVLGRHRPDDTRSGWLSGLPEEEGAQSPTLGGLRIGKPLSERRPDEPFDDRLEWDRDGQYFHYLTRWMDALVSAAAVLDEPRYARLAGDLAAAVFPKFLVRSAGGDPVGLAWKMSIDLSRPQVAGMNPQDALDGYVTFRLIDSGNHNAGATDLGDETAILRNLSAHDQWETPDPLGVGGLLLSASRLSLLPDRTPEEEQLVGALLAGAEAGLEDFLSLEPLRAPASQRLAFRELGLAIGLSHLPAIAAQADRSPSLAAAAARISPPCWSTASSRRSSWLLVRPARHDVPTGETTATSTRSCSPQPWRRHILIAVASVSPAERMTSTPELRGRRSPSRLQPHSRSSAYLMSCKVTARYSRSPGRKYGPRATSGWRTFSSA
jgi:hypothetical protein